MAYTKNYFAILSLDTPDSRTTQRISAVEMRRAYKSALLAAHPDKKRSSNAKMNGKGGYTVDEVREAYTVLADEEKWGEYMAWLVSSQSATLRQMPGQAPQNTSDSDFILGLEVLDLADFEMSCRMSMPASPPAPSPTSTSASLPSSDPDSAPDEQTEWTRACRCGADRGFRILESDLEDAEGSGEKEVLVGCEGCSLWVRVGFEVEEEGGDREENG